MTNYGLMLLHPWSLSDLKQEGEVETLEGTVVLGKSTCLEVGEGDLNELNEEREEERSIEELEELSKMQYTKLMIKVSSEDEVQAEEVIYAGKFKNAGNVGEAFSRLSSFIEKIHIKFFDMLQHFMTRVSNTSWFRGHIQPI